MPTVTSPRNPLLKEVRKAILRGTTTEDGFSIAESFHLLEEALRSDCEISTVFAAESVRSAVESHVRGLKKVRMEMKWTALAYNIQQWIRLIWRPALTTAG